MYRLFRAICLPFDYFFILLVLVYKKLISPLLYKTCKFTPTCSTYMIDAIKEYAFLRGILLGTNRLFRCNPWSKGGVDFVPINIKGKAKWIF